MMLLLWRDHDEISYCGHASDARDLLPMLSSNSLQLALFHVGCALNTYQKTIYKFPVPLSQEKAYI